MAFQNYLDNLRAKPEHVRKRIAFWSSLSITVIIFAFWAASFSISGSSAPAVVTTAVTRAGNPGSSLIAGVGNFFGDLKEMIFGAKKVTYREIEVRPGKK